MAKKAQATSIVPKSPIAAEIKPQVEPVDKLASIRDLLFGEEVSRIESLIAQHHQQFSERLERIESVIKSTEQQIEKHLSEAVVQLKQSLNSLDKEHTKQEDKLISKLDDVNSRFKSFQSNTLQDFSLAHNELDQATKEIYQSLAKEIKQVNSKIEAASKELGSNKADRQTIAHLLESMANNLIQPQA